MSASLHFSIKYDGPALTFHQMDVRELAPALFALSELIEQSNKIMFPEGPDVRINVQGNFKSGSFGIDLIVVQDVVHQIVSILSGSEATATANLLAILGGIGLVAQTASGGLIKWLKGRKPGTIRFEDNKTVFEIVEAEVVEVFEADLIAGELYKSRVVRQALRNVIKPLGQEGIETFHCVRDEEITVITKSEVPAFEMSADDVDIVSDALNENVLLQIESAVFKDANKWRFHDGAASFYAQITDDDFIGKINTGERFGKGDMLVVDLRRIQSVTDNGLKLEYQVEKVKEHREPLQKKLI
ncbi:MAG: hypothetical protein LBL72_11495 [Candidatus Accumulibacter sp.]|jgi:hypothetical protein|nr:hypothetical protein [Accumulibacter sp.]